MAANSFKNRLPAWFAWKWAAAGLLIAAVAWEAVTTVKRGGDLESYLRASRRLAAGENIYVDELFPYMYPPLLAFLLLPIAFLDPVAAKLAWYLGNVAFLALALVLLLRLDRPAQRRRAWLVLLSLLFTLRFLVDSFHRGQANILVLLLCVLTLYSLRRGRPAWAAFFLATAIGVKLTAALLLGYLLIRRKFRLGGLVAAFLMLLMLLPAAASGFRRNLDHLQRYPAVAGNIYDRDKLNQSLPNAVFHLLHPVERKDNTDIHLLHLDGGAIKWLARLLALALLLVTAFHCRKGAAGEPMVEYIDFSIVLTLMLLLSPVSRKDHFVTLLVPYFFYFHSLLDPVLSARIGNRKRLWSCLLASFLLNSLSVESVVGNPANDLLESCFCLTLGTIILWLGLLALRREVAGMESGDQDKAASPVLR